MVSTLTCSAAFSACTSPRQTEEKRKEKREEAMGGKECGREKKERIREGAQVREPYHYTTVL